MNADEPLTARLSERLTLAREGIAAVAAGPSDFTAEFLGPVLAVRVVESLDEAVATINRDGSAHSDAIITADAAVARRFGLSSAGVGLRAMAASSLDTSRVQRCRPYRGGGSGVFPGGNETPLGLPRSPLRPGKQRAGAAALAAQHGSGRAMQRLTRPARAGQNGKWGGSCDASP